MSITVIKVGGSLFDLPDLRDRLRDVLLQVATTRILLVAGGGAAADVVRSMQTLHKFSDEAAHKIAMESLRIGERLLLELVPSSQLVTSIADFSSDIGVVQSATFISHERGRNNTPPREDWTFTSDSIAAWIAQAVQASQLVMLKSVDAPTTAQNATSLDGSFIDYVGNTQLMWCNLRSHPPTLTAVPAD